MTWLDNNEFRGLNPELLSRMQESDKAFRWVEAASASDLTLLASRYLNVDAVVTAVAPADMSAIELGNMSHRDLAAIFDPLFPDGTDMADKLADQIQLCRAFSDPVKVVSDVASWVADAARNFPRTAAQLTVGDNRGDVLDPFILAANFELLSSGNFTKTIETSVSHKVLMKIEDLVGNMHQKVLGAMRGNFLLPEPQRGRGGNKEVVVPYSNPFPGTDVGQVPLPETPTAIRLFQVKSKTGSATGGYGDRLGRQLKLLEQTYGAQTFYIAVVGTTLMGHRSMGAVIRESPNTAVLVGDAALNEVCRSDSGAELLLRTYRRAFRAAAARGLYDFESSVLAIQAAFQSEAEEAGTDFIDAWLAESTSGTRREQDTRLGVYPRPPRSRKH